MRYLIITFVAVFAFSGVAFAATYNPNLFKMTNEVWGIVQGERNEDSKIYRLVDEEFNNVCYVAYHGVNKVPDMECVHGE